MKGLCTLNRGVKPCTLWESTLRAILYQGFMHRETNGTNSKERGTGEEGAKSEQDREM